jgi:ankyrin repeat protein
MEWVDKAMRARSNKERHRLLIEARYLGKPPAKKRQDLLQHAIDFNDLPLLEQMVAEGADLNALFMRETPLQWTILRRRPKFASILLKGGADPNRPSSGYPPVYGAVSYNQPGILAGLIQAGADVNRTHPRDASALIYACLYGNADIVKALIAAGANVNQAGKPIAMQRATAKMTPLMVAAMWGHAAIVKLLLAAGADVGAKDGKGHTALDWARSKKGKGNEQSAKLIAAAGAQSSLSAVDPDGVEVDFTTSKNAPGFLAAVTKLKKLTRVSPSPMHNIEGQIDGPVAFLVPEARAKAIVEEHQDSFLKQGCYLIQTRDTAGKGGNAVAIFPTKDVYQVLAALQTEGANSNVYNQDLIRWLRSLREPLRVTGAGYDFLSGRFLKSIGNPTALMKSIAKICPDADEGPSSLRAQAKRLTETRELFLWWD